MEDIFKDIEEARQLFPYVASFFLIDGNVLALKTDFLLKIIEKIKSDFPECKKNSLYAGLNDLRRKSVSELSELKQVGLSVAYSGLESGDPEILRRVKEGLTPEQAISGMKHAKAAGIDVLLSFIFGLGGKERSREHIIATTKLLNILEPEEMAPMALAVQSGTELAREIERGEFIQTTPLQILEEEKYLLENLTDFNTFYWGDHGNNIISSKGRLPEHREEFLKKIEDVIATHPVTHQDVLKTFAW